MEPLRSLERQDSEKSEARREHLRVNAAVQNVTDTMIAVTESFRHHYQQQHGGYAPPAPAPTYTHSRNSSNSSESTERLLDVDPMRHMSVSDMSPSSISPYQTSPVPNVLVPGRSPDAESDSLLETDMYTEMTETTGPAPEDLIRLATPNLPARLDTPHTPPPRFSIPVNLSERQPHVSPPQLATDFSVNHGGLVNAARRFEAFRSTTQHHQYMVLRPDVGTETQPLGTTTLIRAGTDVESPVSKGDGLRRKPLTRGAKPIEFNYATNETLFVAVICMAQVLAFAGLAQTLVPARKISESFSESERTTGHLAWYSAAYALGFGATTLVGNRLGSVCGQRQTFILGYLWFALWSLVAGLSIYVQRNGNSGAVYFCVCRGMQGIGPALITPNGQAMLQRAYPPGPRKTLAMGLFDAAVPLGLVLGSVMTGLFAGFGSWSWAFYSLAAVCLALGVSSALLIPSKRVLVHDFEGNLWKRLDILGLVFGVAALVLFCVGWNQAPNLTFESPVPYILIFAGLILIPLFTFFETQASHPLVPVKSMHIPSCFTLGFVAASWAAFGVWIWYFAQFMEVLGDWKPLLVGAGLVPVLVVGVVVGFMCCPFVNHDLTAHLAMVVTAVFTLIGSALMATASEKQSYWVNPFISTIFMGAGIVLVLPASVTGLTRSVPQGQPGLASSLSTTWAAFSFAVSLGMAGAVEMGNSNRGTYPREGYRDAQYFGLGMSGLSLVLALGLLCAACLRR